MERTREKWWFCSVLLAGIIALGGVFSWLCLVWIGYAFISQWTTIPPHYKRVIVTTDRHALLQESQGKETTYETASGQPVDAKTFQEMYSYAYLSSEGQKAPPDASFWAARIAGFSDQKRPMTNWYLICDNQSPRRSYFEGYDSKSKKLVGYIGKTGFRIEPPPETEQFLIDNANTLHSSVAAANRVGAAEPSESRGNEPNHLVSIVSGGKLFVIDLNERMVAPIALSSDVHSVSYVRDWSVGDSDAASRVLARGRDRVFVLTPEGMLEYTLKLPESVRAAELYLHDWRKPEFILSATQHTSDDNVTDCYWLKRDGQVVRHESFPLAIPDRKAGKFFAVTVPSPVLLTAGGVLIASASFVEGEESEKYMTVLATFVDQWPGLVIVGVASLIGAVFCYSHHRRYYERGALLWAIFALIAGPFGAIAYGVRRKWPKVELGQTIAAPTMRQIEIFA